MYKLGITGGIGSGKSTVCNYLNNKGASVFDSDKKSKELLLNNNSELSFQLLTETLFLRRS